MTVQSIIFNKQKWSQLEAERWLASHGFKSTFYRKPVDETANYYRYRQSKPTLDDYYFTKTVEEGIKMIIKN